MRCTQAKTANLGPFASKLRKTFAAGRRTSALDLKDQGVIFSTLVPLTRKARNDPSAVERLAHFLPRLCLGGTYRARSENETSLVILPAQNTCFLKASSVVVAVPPPPHL